MSTRTIRLTVKVTNIYPDTKPVREERQVVIPRPRDVADEEGMETWAYAHLFPLTGTGRTEGEGGYFVKITESPDLPILEGSEFDWGI
jgi:hypothetical protein